MSIGNIEKFSFEDYLSYKMWSQYNYYKQNGIKEVGFIYCLSEYCLCTGPQRFQPSFLCYLNSFLNAPFVLCHQTAHSLWLSFPSSPGTVDTAITGHLCPPNSSSSPGLTASMQNTRASDTTSRPSLSRTSLRLPSQRTLIVLLLVDGSPYSFWPVT